MFATETELDELLQDHPFIEYIDAIVIDLCGRAIGKRLPVGHVAKMLKAGTPVCAAMQLVDVRGNTADPMGFGFSDGDPDGMARPIAGTFAPIPWSGGKGGQVLCQMTRATNGETFWYEPRKILADVTEMVRGLGLRPVVALELEFYLTDLGRAEDGGPIPAASPVTGERESQGQVLSLAKLDEYGPILNALQEACRAQGLPVSTVICEYGPGQFEINLEHQTDPLRAADHAALLRRAVQGAARAQGFDVTFMSKPFPGLSGNGLHIHLSLLDDEGRNIFDPAWPEGEKLLGHAVGGLQATLHEAMAIFAPNINVYRRFKPDEFTPVTRDWGENNRSVAFRLPPVTDGAARRLEHRVAGAEANPYLVTAAVLAGVHYGLTNRLDPGAKHTGNAGAALDETLPNTFWDALAALGRAEILTDYFGEDYLDLYRQVKAAELEAFMETISRQEYDWYL
jgi:glutamine synthetase